MDSILICEDDSPRRYYLQSQFKKAFPDYNILATGSLEEACEIAEPVINTIKVVFTDGQLDKEKINYGWHLAEKLKELGYDGPIVYNSLSPVPKEKEYLFTKVILKDMHGLKDIKLMIEYANLLFEK